MGRLRVDPKQLNTTRISMLVNDPANAAPLVRHFVEHGYTIEVLTEASKMYTHLCEGAPGFVMISTQVDGAMAKMMPDFVIKRFGAPVIFFRETQDQPSPPLPSAAILPPEMIPALDLSVEQLQKTFENFEQVYQMRVADRTKPIAELAEMRGEGPTPESAVELVGMESPSAVESSILGPDGASPSDEILRMVKSSLLLTPINVTSADVVTLHACKIADPKGHGYFIFAFPARDGRDPAEAIRTLEGRVAEIVGGPAVVDHVNQAMPTSLLNDLERHSDEVVTGLFGEQEMILLYFRDRKDVEEPDIHLHESNVLVPVEEWWTRLPLPMHAYVWLARNQRRILYVRPGDRLRGESYDRFLTRGVKHLAIDAEDYSHYLKIREMIHVATNGPRLGIAA